MTFNKNTEAFILFWYRVLLKSIFGAHLKNFEKSSIYFFSLRESQTFSAEITFFEEINLETVFHLKWMNPKTIWDEKNLP